jgi:release factor glutamine methyltransferase
MDKTVRGAVSRGIRILAENGVDCPRLTSELLLAHVLGWERVRVLSHGEACLDPEQETRFDRLVTRRAGGEPLQYLTGEREFFGLSFLVSPAVLIPRPETEILVESAVRLAREDAPNGAVRFLDVGTGSGCIAISIAKLLPCARGWGLDLSLEALAIARRNADRHGVSSRVGFVCGDLLACLARTASPDLIVANLPYVGRAEAAALAPIVRDHEPAVACYAGESGMEIYERFIPEAAQCLAAGGHLLLEAGARQAAGLAEAAAAAGLAVREIVADLQGIPRCVIAGRNPRRMEADG